MNFIRNRPDAVDTSDALHEARSIPRRIVVDDEVRSMKVHAFGKHVTRYHDLIFILLVVRFDIGIEIGSNRIGYAVAILRRDCNESFLFISLGELFCEVVDRIDAF